MEQSSSFRVTSKSPFDTKILHLISCDSTSVSTTRVLRYVLRGNLNVVADLLKSCRKMDLGWSYDNLHQVGIICSFVQNFLRKSCNELTITI